MTSDRPAAAEGLGGVPRRESSDSEDASQPEARPTRPQEPASSGSLGKRIARWASNLLVSGVILIVGLVFGREVIGWWRSGDGTNRNPAVLATAHRQTGAEHPDATAAEQLLSFGDFPHALRRSELVGDVPTVLHHLRVVCREVLADAKAVSGEPGPAELKMLQGTAELTPVDSLSGEWSIYELQAPLPMVVGIRETPEVGGEVVAAPRRVVSWGMAFPAVAEAAGKPTSWTLFTYATGSGEAQSHDEFSLPAPPSGWKTLSLQTDANGAMRGFRGYGSARDWMAFYDKWFESNAWQATAGWQSDETATWRRRFEHHTEGTIEFVLSASDSGSIQAIAVHTP